MVQNWRRANQRGEESESQGGKEEQTLGRNRLIMLSARTVVLAAGQTPLCARSHRYSLKILSTSQGSQISKRLCPGEGRPTVKGWPTHRRTRIPPTTSTSGGLLDGSAYAVCTANDCRSYSGPGRRLLLPACSLQRVLLSPP